MNIIQVLDKKDMSITLHPMKKIELVVPSENEHVVAAMIEKANITGFTLIKNISGKGHSGFHEGSAIFNDKESFVMFIAVAPEDAIASIAFGMKTLFQKNSGVMFVSDVSVARVDYFS
ncbi:P-II family nitrogen regulator [Legionella sp. W05-934-2]|uniref:P-II family nitrogen regulator n=1 Tax=Legionella sp. W05-934-2 TaxID=1198649 RepID=UPI003463633C